MRGLICLGAARCCLGRQGWIPNRTIAIVRFTLVPLPSYPRTTGHFVPSSVSLPLLFSSFAIAAVVMYPLLLPIMLGLFAPPPETRFPVLLLRRFLLFVPRPGAFLLAMVIAGGLELLLEHAVVASVVREKSPPVTASGNVAAKPPKPPAPKTLSSPTAGPVAPPAAVVAPQAPVRPEPPQVAPAAVVVPLVAPVLAAPVIAAAPAALSGGVRHHWRPGPGGGACRGCSVGACSTSVGSAWAAESPQRRSSGGNWHARRGGRGGWRGGYGRGRGGAFDGPVTMADLQRVVTAAMREERALQANQQLPRATATPPPVAPPVTAPAAVAPQPPAPPAPYPSFLPCDSASRAAGVAQPFETFVGSSRAAEVPEATLGQLWHLSEGLRAVHLIQMYGHAGLSLGNTLVGGSRDECPDAADRLAELLAPVLAAPARGGVAGVGQLGTAVRGLRHFLRAGTAANVIGASTAVVRELHRSLTGLLAVLDAD
ncbi:unnamed protein product [Closterium sp. Naga37s-1]|nr:unnamed protein product [Closterium sp. Naga37s-1]